MRKKTILTDFLQTKNKELKMANEGYHEPIEQLRAETRDMHRAIVSLMEENEDLERETPDKTAAAHFMHFELSPGMVAAVKRGATIRAGIDHPACFEATQLPEAVRDSLAGDLI